MRQVFGVAFKYGSREELLPELDEAFPCVTNCYGFEKGGGAPWHWHQAVELFYVERRTLAYATPQGRALFSEGWGGVVNAGVPHMTAATTSGQQHGKRGCSWPSMCPVGCWACVPRWTCCRSSVRCSICWPPFSGTSSARAGCCWSMRRFLPCTTCSSGPRSCCRCCVRWPPPPWGCTAAEDAGRHSGIIEKGLPPAAMPRAGGFLVFPNDHAVGKILMTAGGAATRARLCAGYP